jgi:hypothetical protein
MALSTIPVRPKFDQTPDETDENNVPVLSPVLLTRSMSESEVDAGGSQDVQCRDTVQHHHGDERGT